MKQKTKNSWNINLGISASLKISIHDQLSKVFLCKFSTLSVLSQKQLLGIDI